jgi:hypothetical protein
MRVIRLAWLPFSLLLTACGTYVPEIEEGYDPAQGQILVQNIVRNVNCEVRNAVVALYELQPDEASFLDEWAVQTDLMLAVDEKGGISPSASLLPPSPVNALFSLSLGATASSEARRISKFGQTITVAEIRKRGKCGPNGRTHGPNLLQSDLKLDQWLFDVIQVPYTHPGDRIRDTFSQEVSFDVVTSVYGVPGWRLVRATVNQSGTFLSASRQRTQNLIVTFGPAVKASPGQAAKSPVRLADHAASTALSSQISSAITTGINNALNR